MSAKSWRRRLAGMLPRLLKQRSAPLARRTRPVLENLEERMLPSTTIVVSDLNDDGSAGSLRAAVQQADQTGGPVTIKLQSGSTYHLNNRGNILGDLPVMSAGAAAVDLTITTTGSAPATIDANLTSRLFEVFGATGAGGALLTLANVHLNRGMAVGAGGGAVLVDAGGTFNLQQSAITNCVDQGTQDSAAEGGAILNNGTTAIQNSQVRNNSALAPTSASGVDAYGGGILDNGALNVSNSTFSGNTAVGGASSGSNPVGGGGFGGAIALTNLPGPGSPNLQVTGSTFAYNRAVGGNATLTEGDDSAQGGLAEGGALFWSKSQNGLLVNDTFAFNTAQGGNASVAASLSQHGSHLEGQDDDHGPGDDGDDHDDDGPGDDDHGDNDQGDDDHKGPGHDDDADLAYGGDAQGGAIFFDGSGSLELGFDTIAYNHACAGAGSSGSGSALGGGIVSAGNGNDPDLSMENTLVAKNGAASGSPDVMGGFSSLGHNLIGNVSGGTGFSTTGGDILGGSSYGAPIGPGLDIQLRNNGGPTQTLALLPGSIAIDHGDNTFTAVDTSVDQRGISRPQPVGGTVDIGAYEVTKTRVFFSEAYSVHWNPTTADNNSISGNLLTPLLNAGKLSATNNTLAVSMSNPPAGLTLQPNGTFTYKPPLGFFAVVPPFSFQVHISVNGQDLGYRLNVSMTVYRGLRLAQQV